MKYTAIVLHEINSDFLFERYDGNPEMIRIEINSVKIAKAAMNRSL